MSKILSPWRKTFGKARWYRISHDQFTQIGFMRIKHRYQWTSLIGLMISKNGTIPLRSYRQVRQIKQHIDNFCMDNGYILTETEEKFNKLQLLI